MLHQQLTAADAVAARTYECMLLLLLLLDPGFVRKWEKVALLVCLFALLVPVFVVLFNLFLPTARADRQTDRQTDGFSKLPGMGTSFFFVLTAVASRRILMALIFMFLIVIVIVCILYCTHVLYLHLRAIAHF